MKKYKCIDPYPGELILNKIYTLLNDSDISWFIVINERNRKGCYWHNRFVEIKPKKIHEIW